MEARLTSYLVSGLGRERQLSGVKGSIRENFLGEAEW